MRAVFGYAFLGVLLAAGGVLFRVAGQMERRLQNADIDLVTLKDMSAADSNRSDAVESASVLPWIADLERKMREQQAASRYWRSDYPSLELRRDSNGEPTEKDSEILLVAADAEYRKIKPAGNDTAVPQKLQNVMDMFAEVLKRDPGNSDAAYNYEFVARLRDSLSRPLSSKSGDKGKTVSKSMKPPPEQTVHGIQGAPPDSTDMSPFKLLVPKQGDERKEDPEAGKGEKKIRKG